MEYFIIKKNPLYVYNPVILELGSHINMNDFKKNGTTHIPSRIFLNCTLEEFSIFPTFLLERLPLFTKLVKNTIDCFYNKVIYKEIIIGNGSKNQIYYLANLKMVGEENCKYNPEQKRFYIEKAGIMQEDIFYVKQDNEVVLCANLIIIEDLYRKGANGFILEKAEIHEERVYANGYKG